MQHKNHIVKNSILEIHKATMPTLGGLKRFLETGKSHVSWLIQLGIRIL